MVSCICFSAMLKLCHGVSFCDPGNKLIHRRISNGFVGDVTHWFNLQLLHIACSTKCWRFKILHQDSNEKVNHGNIFYGPRGANSNSPNVCTTFSFLHLRTGWSPPHEICHQYGQQSCLSHTSGQEPIPSNIEHHPCCSKACPALGM